MVLFTDLVSDIGQVCVLRSLCTNYFAYLLSLLLAQNGTVPCMWRRWVVWCSPLTLCRWLSFSLIFSSQWWATRSKRSRCVPVAQSSSNFRLFLS